MLTRLVATALLVVALSPSARATDTTLLPDKPTPQPRTATAEYWAQVGAMSAAWAADTITTHAWVTRCPYCTEAGAFFPGSRNTAKIMASWAAVDIGAAVVSYEWKRHVHNRYLHGLWRVPLLLRTESHSQAALHNTRLY